MASALEEVYAQLRAPRTLVGLGEQQSALRGLIEAAFRDRQSTSVLCLGRPGTGKTACVNTVIEQLPSGYGARVVRLTGHLHAQAHIGLRETLSQLGAHDDPSEKKKAKNVAPEEMVPVLLDRLQRIAGQNRPIVLVLSRFERFAAQPRQTLLYSLLELTHSAHSVVLIGVTSAFDALDQLEKRVRSRFSHRHVLFLGPQTVDDIKRIAQAALIVDGKAAGAAEWNAACETLLRSTDATTVLTQHLQHTNDVRHFLNLLSLAVTNAGGGPPTVDTLQQASRSILSDSKGSFLRALSVAEAVLVIVYSKLRRQGITRINFELIWEQVSRPQQETGWFVELGDKATMLRVMERLCEIGVFRFSSHSARTLPPAFRLVQLQATDSQVTQALQSDSANGEVSTLLKAWSR